jgi:glycosyltransferase involved in cell wall biosynthesis
MMQEPVICISQASFTAINRIIYRKLQEKGWNIQLIAPSHLEFPGGKKETQPAEPGDPPMHFLELQGKNPRVQWYKGLKQLLRNTRPRIIYLDNDPASRLAARLSIWCNRNNAVLICQSCENLSIQPGEVYKREGIKGIPAALVKNFFGYWSKKYCSHVFVISNDGERVFNELGYRSVSKTPLGFDENIFFPDETARKTVRAEKKLNRTVFSYFGRIVPEKGVHILLDALAQVKDLEWQLLMDDFEVYKSPYIEVIKKQIDELGLQDRVVYFHASHTEIARYMNAADVVVLASVSTPKWVEQYGRVVPEAMACGRLVVVARSGALPELADDAGIIFEEKNITQLAGIIRDIILHPDNYAAYNNKAHQRAYAQLSVNRQAAIMDSKFRELLQPKPIINN